MCLKWPEVATNAWFKVQRSSPVEISAPNICFRHVSDDLHPHCWTTSLMLFVVVNGLNHAMQHPAATKAKQAAYERLV